MFMWGSTLKKNGELDWGKEKQKVVVITEYWCLRERERGSQKKKRNEMKGCVSGHIYCIKLHAMLSFHLPKNQSIPPLFESGVTGIFGHHLRSHLLHSFLFPSHSHPKVLRVSHFFSSCLSFSFPQYHLISHQSFIGHYLHTTIHDISSRFFLFFLMSDSMNRGLRAFTSLSTNK